MVSKSFAFPKWVVSYRYSVIRAASPPFSEYIARTQKLEGDFRRMHSRLITHAEEVAFLDGATRRGCAS